MNNKQLTGKQLKRSAVVARLKWQMVQAAKANKIHVIAQLKNELHAVAHGRAVY
jgi:hypothetical protein